MCGRMTLTLDIETLAEALGASATAEARAMYRPRYNLPPTDPQVVALAGDGGRILTPMRWGLGRDKPIINARAESVATNGLFKRALHSGRCLIPADGFYEWTGPKNARRPIWFHPAAGGVMTFAGIFDSRGFCVITVPANADTAPVHDRMPAILSGEMRDRWLREVDTGLLQPAPAGMLQATPVSSRVSKVQNDDPACLGPPEEGQLDLIR